MKNTFAEYYLLCPYCEGDLDPADTDLGTDSLDVPQKCNHCEKNFYASTAIVFSSRADCSLNNEEHDFRPHSLLEDNWVECVKCKMDKRKTEAQ